MSNTTMRTRLGITMLLGAGLVTACGIPDEQVGAETGAVLAQAESAHVEPADGPGDGAGAVLVSSMSKTGPAADEAAGVATAATYEGALSEYRRGRYTEAQRLFTDVSATHPADAQTHYMLGLSAWKSGDRGTAVEALSRAVEVDSTVVKARTNLSRVLLEQGRAGDALPHMESATELEPESHEVWRVLGNVYSELGRSDDALEAYRQALVRNPDDAWSTNNYGLVLIRLGRYEDALPALARAVELVPGSPVFRNNLGVALERTGRIVSAGDAFAAAVDADSTYTRAVISLERVRGLEQVDAGGTPDLESLARDFVTSIEEWREAQHYGC